MGLHRTTALAIVLGVAAIGVIASAQESPPVPGPESLPAEPPEVAPPLDPFAVAAPVAVPTPAAPGRPAAWTGAILSPDAAEPAPDAPVDPAAPPDAAAPVAGAETETPAVDPAPDPGIPIPPRSRAAVRNAAVAIRTFTPEETMDRAVDALEALGAYIQESRTGWASLRVPADRLDAAVEALRGVGEVVREDRTLEDVTLEIVTLEARMRELEASRRRIQGMLAVAATVSDTLAVERTLQQVTSDLEAQQGRHRFLLDRVEFAPLELEVSMKARPAPVRPSNRPPFPWVREYGLEAVLR